jgi:hypothetical protein
MERGSEKRRRRRRRRRRMGQRGEVEADMR